MTTLLYILWAVVMLATLRACWKWGYHRGCQHVWEEVVRRQEAQLAAYLMVEDVLHHSGIEGLSAAITCPQCARTSYNANDIAQGWCGNCKAYTSDPQPDDVRQRVAAFYTPNRQRGPADASGAFPWTKAHWHPDVPVEPS